MAESQLGSELVGSGQWPSNKTLHEHRLMEYTTTAKEHEIGRLMNILEVDLCEEKLNGIGQKLIDSQHKQPERDI